jgi:hypothetical protein
MADPSSVPSPPVYWLTRFLLLRLLGLVYLVAFLVAAWQFLPLAGEHGLTPAPALLRALEQFHGGKWNAFREVPTLFFWNHSDSFVHSMAWTGVALSLVVLCGFANVPVLVGLWFLYLSFLHAGGLWYGYGWETQLLETGFLAIFLVPLFDPRPFPKSPPPIVTIWLYRWLIFRIMLGAGLIKIRGDECWRDLTALFYHYETQPVPNPLSPLLHAAPGWFHRIGVLTNHFIELIVPWFVFWPRLTRPWAGLLLILFQVTLICSGNLSFLNWLTLIPCLACLDDSLWARILPPFLTRRAREAEVSQQRSRFQFFTSVAFACAVAWLSLPVVRNLLSPNQAMNTSFDNLHLVNSYGAFGSVGRERYELIVQGTREDIPAEFAEWKEYEFKVKPGDPMRAPAIITPYHHRLDWQIWFAAMASPEHYPWTVALVWHLLENDPATLGLLANNPFPDGPPKFLRILRYRYEFTPPGDPNGAWWKRERLDIWLPPISLQNHEVRNFLQGQGWIPSS